MSTFFFWERGGGGEVFPGVVTIFKDSQMKEKTERGKRDRVARHRPLLFSVSKPHNMGIPPYQCVGLGKKRDRVQLCFNLLLKRKNVVYFRHRHLQLGKLQLYILLVFGYRSNIRQGEKVYESCRKRDWNFITPFFYYFTCLVISSSFSHRQQGKGFQSKQLFIFLYMY